MEPGASDSSVEGSFSGFAKVRENNGRGRGGAWHKWLTKLHPFSSEALRIVVGGSSRGRDYTCNPHVCDHGGRCFQMNA